MQDTIVQKNSHSRAFVYMKDVSPLQPIGIRMASQIFSEYSCTIPSLFAVSYLAIPI